MKGKTNCREISVDTAVVLCCYKWWQLLRRYIPTQMIQPPVSHRGTGSAEFTKQNKEQTLQMTRHFQLQLHNTFPRASPPPSPPPVWCVYNNSSITYISTCTFIQRNNVPFPHISTVFFLPFVPPILSPCTYVLSPWG